MRPVVIAVAKKVPSTAPTMLPDVKQSDTALSDWARLNGTTAAKVKQVTASGPLILLAVFCVLI